MKKILLHRLSSLLLLFFCLGIHKTVGFAVPVATTWSPSLGADPMIWKMRSKAEAKGLILQHLNSPRQMYYLINEAYVQNLEGTVAQDLANRLEANGEDPKFIVLASYAALQAAGSASRGFWGDGTPETMGINAQFGGIKAFLTLELFRELKDPALIIMAASVLADDWYPRNIPIKHWQILIDRLEWTLRRTPRWGDVHYQMGEVLSSYASEVWRDKTFNPEMKDRIPAMDRVNRRAKKHLLTAIRLDPGLKANGYHLLSYIYKDLDEPRKGLELFKQAQKLTRNPTSEWWQKREIADFEKAIQEVEAEPGTRTQHTEPLQTQQ